MEKTTHVFHGKEQINFEGGKIIGSTDSIYKKREQQLNKQIKDIEKKQETSEAKLSDFARKIDEILVRVNSSQQVNAASSAPATSSPISSPLALPQTNLNDPVLPQSNPLVTERVEARVQSGQPRVSGPRLTAKGPATISFPVKETDYEELGIVIPAGSYVKSTVMTGIEAPEGKNYPVLLQLDYAFVGPSKTRIDLTGCFGIAKAQGDLSTERVQMQLTKISCVSQKGKMFEREVNGFVADDKDNSFAVVGTVNSKQDRLAAVAFLSSVVEGVGKAIQQAQTSQQQNALGASQTMISGDQGRYIGAGGVANAATMVTQWYLDQAKNLLPTINVGSGQNLWVVIQDKVDLPNWYFRKSESTERTVYSHFTNTLD